MQLSARPQAFCRTRKSLKAAQNFFVPRAASVGGPVATRSLTLHSGDTTIAVPFSVEQGNQLQAAFQQLFQTFAEKQKAQRPKRWDMLEWRGGDGDHSLEVFCNPNAHATAFDAKLLITLVSRGGLRITTEARLSAVTSDLDSFLQG